MLQTEKLDKRFFKTSEKQQVGNKKVKRDWLERKLERQQWYRGCSGSRGPWVILTGQLRCRVLLWQILRAWEMKVSVHGLSSVRTLGNYSAAAAAAAKSLQSCPTLCDPIDSSPPGSPVPGILQARTLEWVAMSFSNAWKWKVKVKSLSLVRLLATPWTVAYQAPPSMGFSRQEYWSGVPLPSPTLQP